MTRIPALRKRNNFSYLSATLLLVISRLAIAQTPQPPTLPGTISTVNTGGVTLKFPAGVAVDSKNNLYISDADNNQIVKLNQQNGTASVVAINGSLSFPEGIALDANGDLYVTEAGSGPGTGKIRKIDAVSQAITDIVTGLNEPFGVAVDSATNSLYIAENGAGAVKKFDGSGLSTIIAGGSPTTVAFANGYLYVVDTAAGTVDKVRPSAPNSPTVLISGLDHPWGVALDPAGDVYISEYGDQSKSEGGRVLMVSAADSTVKIIAGNGAFAYTDAGGSALNASFEDGVTGLAVGPDGSLYVADGTDKVVRKISFPASSGGSNGSTGSGSGSTGGSGNPAPVYNVPGCNVISFSAGPNPIYTNSNVGLTTVLANVTCPYEIHIGSPSGNLFATGNGYTSTLTGNWVQDGMQFYLQQSGNTTPQGTITAPITVHLKPGFPGLACVATAFTASPNPMITNDQFGQTTITAVTNCSFDIRINAPDGKEFQEGRGFAAMPTGKWVTNGMTMYLQPHGDTSAADTLATLKLIVQPAPAGCTVTDFSSPENPIKTKDPRSVIHVHANASCAYDVRAQSPSGGLLGSASGDTTMTTGQWVTNSMTFFLQKSGSTTADGTLATFTVDVHLPDQPTPNCPIIAFNLAQNPLIAANGSANSTVNVNASCQWDLRLNDAAGTVLGSGNNSGSVPVTGVTNGTQFYLQPHNDTYYGDNLAILSATVGAQAPAACTALVFTATPVQSDASFGVSTITADATCPYDIRIGSPDGSLFASANGFTSANTGNWVQFGQQFFLQKQGDTTSAGTLASQSAIVLP